MTPLVVLPASSLTNLMARCFRRMKQSFTWPTRLLAVNTSAPPWLRTFLRRVFQSCQIRTTILPSVSFTEDGVRLLVLERRSHVDCLNNNGCSVTETIRSYLGNPETDVAESLGRESEQAHVATLLAQEVVDWDLPASGAVLLSRLVPGVLLLLLRGRVHHECVCSACATGNPAHRQHTCHCAACPPWPAVPLVREGRAWGM